MAGYKEAITHTQLVTVVSSHTYSDMYTSINECRCGSDVVRMSCCVSVCLPLWLVTNTLAYYKGFFNYSLAVVCLSASLCVCVCFFFLNKVYLLVFDALPLEGNAKTWQQWRGDRVQTQPLCPDENQSVPAAVCEWHFGLLIHWPINLLCSHLVSLMFVYVRVCVCVWGPSCHIHALRWVLVYLNHGWNRQVYTPLVTKALGLGNRSLSSWVNNLVREYEWNEFGLIWG